MTTYIQPAFSELKVQTLVGYGNFYYLNQSATYFNGRNISLLITGK